LALVDALFLGFVLGFVLVFWVMTLALQLIVSLACTKTNPGRQSAVILDSTGQQANECPVFKELRLQVKISKKL
jgi:hypothetical protein